MISFEDNKGVIGGALVMELLIKAFNNADADGEELLSRAKLIAERQGVWAGVETLKALMDSKFGTSHRFTLADESGYELDVIVGKTHSGLRISNADAAVKVRYNSERQRTFVTGEKGGLGKLINQILAEHKITP